MHAHGASDVKVALIGCLGAIVAAIIGLGTPLVDRLIDRLIPPPATPIVTLPTERPDPPSTPPPPTFHMPTEPGDATPGPPLPPDDPPDTIAFDPPATTRVTPQLHVAIANFLAHANQVEIYTRYTGDLTYAYDVFGDTWLAALEHDIATLATQGLVQLAYFDGPNSSIRNITIVDDATITVDTCEFWSSTYYRLSDHGVQHTRPPELLPQTITLEHIDNAWLITHVEHYSAPHFCQ